MTETLLISLTAFAGTNIDDLLINTFLFADSKTPSDACSLTAGKYLGMGTLTAISILSALGLQLLKFQYLSLLGVVPILLGIRSIIETLRGTNGDASPQNRSHTLWIHMMIVTIANGADNLGVYIPLFTGFSAWQMAATVCVFALMTGLSCLLAAKLSRTALLRNFLNRYRSVIVPAVYILLGLYILL